MTGSDDKPSKQAKPTKTGGREARLAAALRENLRRRKMQERGRGTPDGADRAGAPGMTPRSDENR